MTSSMGDIQPRLPKVGETRCYWCILSARLDFLYVDPVLEYHLDQQASAVLSKNLLDFIHPDEVHNARSDLQSIVSYRGLHGSVTRVRFCRLSRVRTTLGFAGPVPAAVVLESAFPDAHKIVYDERYMTCELVLNWAADHPDYDRFGGGFMLCFIHAVVDIDRVRDNDEQRRTNWSNWCGTPYFNAQHAAHLLETLRTPSIIASWDHFLSDTRSDRVFQIVTNDEERHVLFSWPPESRSSRVTRLVKDVQIEPGGAARTSCQRRFQSQDFVDGMLTESIFVLHGSIIFACHKLGMDPSSSPATPHSLYPQASPYYARSEGTPHYQGNHTPVQTTEYESKGFGHRSIPPIITRNEHWSYTSQDITNQHSGTYASPTPYSPTHYQGHSRVTSRTLDNWADQNSRPHTPSGLNPLRDHDPVVAPPIPHRATSPFPSAHRSRFARVAASRGEEGHQVGERQSANIRPMASATSSASTSTQYASRSAGLPPLGVIRCASCKTTASPEWRKGPSGKKELCNACGLRYARSRAKKEGHQPQKRKKEEKNADDLLQKDRSSPNELSGMGASAAAATTSQDTAGPPDQVIVHAAQDPERGAFPSYHGVREYPSTPNSPAFTHEERTYTQLTTDSGHQRVTTPHASSAPTSSGDPRYFPSQSVHYDPPPIFEPVHPTIVQPAILPRISTLTAAASTSILSPCPRPSSASPFDPPLGAHDYPAFSNRSNPSDGFSHERNHQTPSASTYGRSSFYSPANFSHRESTMQSRATY